MMDFGMLYNESATKSETRQKILRAAERIFSKHGIEGTSMAMIAEGADTTIRNLYRYYPEISSLVIDTAYYVLRQIDNGEQFRIEEKYKGETGLFMVEKAVAKFVSHYRNGEDNIDRSRFMLYFDIYLSKMDKNDPTYKMFRKQFITQMENGANGLIEAMLVKGISDGSIKESCDTDFYSRFIINSIVGLIVRIDLNEYGNPEFGERLLETQIDVILYNIKK